MTRRISILLWSLACLLGLSQAWLGRYSMNPDGVAYLDISDAFLSGNWKAAANAYWSPLYPWILSLAFRILRRSPEYEYPIVHLVNFLIFLAAFASLHFLLNQLIQWNQKRQDEIAIPAEWSWLLLGGSLFFWAALRLITVREESPDMLMLAFLFLAAGLLLKIRRGPARIADFIFLGLVLGVGYLSKTPMFPVGIVFLILAFASIGNFKKAVPLTLTAAFVFLIVSAPLVIELSLAEKRFTFGDNGRLNYAWRVNRVPGNVHWQGGTPGNGQPLHPTRRIAGSPPVFEFAVPVGGTYPPWFDPTYWYDGVETHFHIRQELSRLVLSATVYSDLIFGLQENMTTDPIFAGDVLVVGYVFLMLLSRRRGKTLHDLFDEWPLLIPALFGLLLFALVSVRPRYVAGFLVLFWLALFSSIRLARSSENKKIWELISVSLSLVMILSIAIPGLLDAYSGMRDAMEARDTEMIDEDWRVVENLSSLGIHPGDKVANIGYSFGAYWARLARVRIVTEITEQDEGQFWADDPSVRHEVYAKFAATGAKIAVSDHAPPHPDEDGWHRIGNTSHYFHPLP